MIGRALGQYRILEELGRGGMGTVYLGEDVQLHRRVAIKVISGAAHADPAARARFLQEARAASALDHPNICAIYQIGETEEGAPFLVMAHYDGETLDKRIAAGPMRIGEAVGIAAQVADGLAHAHARGVVHRDIKPSNVLRTRDGVVKILDFGLAKIVGAESMTVTGVSIGTPAYMSPEQVRAEPVDARSDVWAVGVLLYALLIGRSPFEAENLAAVTYAILEGEPVALKKLLPRCPDGLQTIVDRCIAKAPKDRYADARALAADLRALAGSLASDDAMTIADSASGARTLQISTPSGTRRAGAGTPHGWVRPALIVAVIAIALFGSRAWMRAHPKEPLRVAVVAPAIEADGDSAAAALASTSTVTAVLGQLADLGGVAPVDASDLKGVPGPIAAARAVGASDLVVASLTAARDDWNVTLRRLSAADSVVRWTSTFTVTKDPRLSLADAIRARVLLAYPGHRARPGVVTSQITPQDFDEYVRLERSFRTNKGNDIPRDSMVGRLESLRQRAPRYLDLHLLEANYAIYQFETRKDAEDLELARAAARRGAEAFPADPRPVRLEYECSLLSGRLDEADSILVELRRRDPGSVEVAVAEARLAEKRGKVDDALAGMKRVIERQPARTYYERLIRMEYSQARYADARRHLEFLMSREPDYMFPRSMLAQLELLYGRPARAESLYSELAGRYPRVIYLSNLSLAQMLQGEYERSARSLQRALLVQPDNSSALLNLADCKALMGQRDSASALYSRVQQQLARGEDRGTPANQLLRAQCLAHLGQMPEAVSLAQEALRSSGDDPDARFQAALVFALAGDRTSCVVNTAAAMTHGMQARWFGLPWFDALRKDAAFLKALGDSTKVAGT